MDVQAQLPMQFGRFRLMRRIGAGGMGEVFLAREEQGPFSRACVVKKVLPSLIENKSFVRRFLDESKVVVRLSHHNIARVYSMGEVSGEYYLAMEYVQGKTISRFMYRLRQLQKEMPIGMALLLGEQLCEGLAYAHDAEDENGQPLHLVHRDLSPANVCVSYRGEVKIIDFGASTSTLKEEQTAPRVVIGNLTYMAPEQARKKLVDRRADVYAAGVVLWELFAWKALPQKGDPVERWRKAANPSWQPPSSLRPKLSPGIDEVIMKAIRADPGDRFASAAAFGAELAALRKRLAPEANQDKLAALLAESFKKEKDEEDAALAEIQAVGKRTMTASQLPTTFIPVTALAFEHRSYTAPASFMRSDIGTDQAESSIEPGEKTQTVQEDSDSSVSEARVAFMEQTNLIDDKLLREIEADAEEHTSPYDTGGKTPWRMLAIGLGLFLGASAIGFLVMWLLTI